MTKFTKTTALILSIAISFSTVPSFASEKVNNVQNNIESIDINENTQPQAFFNSFTGTVKELTDNTNGSTNTLVENKDGTQANFIISESTYFVYNVKIEVGTEITGYYEAGRPMIMIYPAQYSIEIVAPAIEGKNNIKADKFDKDLLSADKTLKLNISEDTEILWENGTLMNWIVKPTILELETALSNRKLIVLYDFTTKSIPAQTTPNKIIVLSPQDDNSSPTIIVNDIEVEAPQVYISESGVVMVPIRGISEALGYDILWNNEKQSIMVGDNISLKIGENSYVVSGKTPVKLESSPIINDGSTYVPLSFFKEVVDINVVSFFENNVIITNGRPIG